jgi:hemerythrin-like domain-containing protein
MDVLQILKKDHKKVKHLFEEFEKLSGRSAQKKHAVVQEIHKLLSAHAQLEEEVVYPALKEIRSEEMKDLLQEAYEEHQVTKTLLAELRELQPNDEHYDAKVKVMGEYVQHHVKEEEKEILPLAQKHLSRKRWEELSSAAEARHQELMADTTSAQQAA